MSRKDSKVAKGVKLRSSCFVACLVKQPCLCLVGFSFIAVCCQVYWFAHCPESNLENGYFLGPLQGGKSFFDSRPTDQCMGMTGASERLGR